MADLRILRNLTGWPAEVPDDLLYAHMDEALREIERNTGLTAAPDGKEADWDSALAWLAAASALPSLHTFTLSGAAKVGRLEGGVEFRFMSADEVAALALDWAGRGRRLLAALNPPTDPAPAETDGTALGAGWMAAI